MDGWKVIVEIRKSLKYDGFVVAYTAYSHKSDIQKCKDLGFNFVLNKPAMPNEILEVLEKVP